MISKSLKTAKLKFAIIGYSDYGRFKTKGDILVFEFTDKMNELEKFLSKAKILGNNPDDAEDINRGFREALKLIGWSADIRLLFHICDNPCHGSQFHDDKVTDDFPKGAPDDDTWENIFTNLLQKRIRYIFLKISPRTDTMIKQFTEIHKKCLNTIGNPS